MGDVNKRAGTVRLGIDLIEETTSIVFVEDTSEAPRMVLEGLNILYLDEEDVAWLGILDLERTRKVMNLG